MTELEKHIVTLLHLSHPGASTTPYPVAALADATQKAEHRPPDTTQKAEHDARTQRQSC